MRHHLATIFVSLLIVLSVGILNVFISDPLQALELESQPYFIKQIEKDRVLAVSPNFRGELTQTSLLPSLIEISENYHIKATRSVKAEKLNGKLVHGLIVYVDAKSANTEPMGVVAVKP